MIAPFAPIHSLASQRSSLCAGFIGKCTGLAYPRESATQTRYRICFQGAYCALSGEDFLRREVDA